MNTIRKFLLFFITFLGLKLTASPFQPTIQKESLLHYARAVNSQYGEEGIIDEILRRMEIKKGFLVEFGGYDGVSMSNTRVLASRGWRGAFIEPDPVLFEKMCNSFHRLPQIMCIKEFVTPFENDPVGLTIDEIADRYFPNAEIDVMCIDIDGLDHLIFKNMKRKPKLVIIEGGMFWHPLMQLEVPDEIAARNVQQPITIMTKIANEKGYKLICSTFNAFFIREDYYHLFFKIDNNPSRMWWEALIHIKKVNPHFYREIFQIRSTDWIREWESKDPAITVELTENYCNSKIKR